MWNIKLTHLFAMVIVVSLSGCGGSGGGEGGSSGSSTGSSAAAASTDEDSNTLADVRIDYDNNLASVYQVDIDVSLPHLSASQVYISVCDNAGGNVESVDYDKCLLKAALQSGTGNYQLRVPNHCESLIAVVSVMEPNTAPLVYTLNHNNQAETTWLIQ
ncbi:hypothetical protein ACXAAV_14440 [Vibrio coralliilyticus]